MDQNTNKADGIQTKTYTATQFIKSVDLTPWELGTACGSCHIGGGFVEKDRNGVRFSSLASIQAQGGAMTSGQPNYGQFDPYLFNVTTAYDSVTGFPSNSVTPAPWAFPYFMGFDPTKPMGPPAVPAGWGQTSMGPGVVAGQLMMPNVKEMDCLFCHFTGYSNLMASVMTQQGMNFFAPGIGSGINDSNSLSPTYQGYNSANVTFGTPVPQMGEPVSLNPAALAKINKKPAMQNCMNCHNVSSLKDMPDMMRDFLSAAPMSFTGFGKSPLTGLEMPAFDFNAPFGMTWNFDQTPVKFGAVNAYGQYANSPLLSKITIGSLFGWFPPAPPDPTLAYAFIPQINFPAAMGGTVYNTATYGKKTTAFADYSVASRSIGGGNPAGTGPLYYETVANSGNDQNALKRGTVPFGRADWFKRGDKFGDVATEVHTNIGCIGCHMDTKTAFVDSASLDGKSQCDPGRGYDSASLTEAGQKDYLTGKIADSRNTVKRCENCHVPTNATAILAGLKATPVVTVDPVYANSSNVALSADDRYNAPNPIVAHNRFKMYSSNVTAVKTGNSLALGNHLDVVECAVCHTYKKQMVVRMLDSTSGNRYPGIFATQKSAGMMGMFSNPMPGTFNEDEEWAPLLSWAKHGNGPTSSADFRRKVYPANIIYAAVWNNEGTGEDHNGDGVNGRGEVTSAGYIDDVVTPFAKTINYDPPIARNMKAGMNFGPSGFDPVPVGFGPSTYASAYAPKDASNNYSGFTGAIKYVGLYGGNINLSTPEEITAYKTYRTTNKANLDNMDWSGVKLGWIGGTYMITHNVRKTTNWVKGQSCADCHAAGKNFFDGEFNTTGYAINTVKAKAAGLDMFRAPAEELEVVAKATDLVTATEVGTKLGSPREVTMEAIGDWAGGSFTPNSLGSYKKVMPAKRAEILYPDNGTYTSYDGKQTFANRAAWVTYLTSLAAAPKAEIANVAGSTAISTSVLETVNGVDVITTNTIQITTGNVTFNVANPDSALEYSWKFSNLAGEVAGTTAARNITSPVNFTVTLIAKNLATGQKAAKKMLVLVKMSYVGQTTTLSATKLTARKVQLAIGTMSLPVSKIQVLWGDGTSSSYKTTSVGYNASHTYYGAASTYSGKVKVISGATVKDEKFFNLDLRRTNIQGLIVP